MKALLKGVRFCIAKGFHWFHVEADSFILVRILNGQYKAPWKVQREINEILVYKSHFASISHCYREANQPADFLSNFGLQVNSDVIFNSFQELPRPVRGCINIDRYALPSIRKI